MRRFMIIAALALASMPLEAQKKAKRDQYKITSEELAEYGSANMGEVIRKARPTFYIVTPASDAGISSGVEYGILVFVGTQQLGDTSMLHFYRASDVEEVRLYRPANALSPYTGGNAFVIQLQMKDRRKP